MSQSGERAPPAHLDMPGARAAVNGVVDEDVRTVEEVFGDEVLEVEVGEDAPPPTGRSARSGSRGGAPSSSTTTATASDGPETVLEPDERYVVAVEKGVSDEVANRLRG